jgi:hypothetical protein
MIRTFPRIAGLALAAATVLTTTAASANAQSLTPPPQRPTLASPQLPVRPAPGITIPHGVVMGNVPRLPQTPVGGNLRFGWDIEVHAGGSWNHASTATTTLPYPGAPFRTFNGLESRAVRSWYFGDGSVLLDTHLFSLGLTSRIVALDSVLTLSSVKPSAFSPFGVRVGRSLTPRVGLEFAFELMGAPQFSSAARDAMELTRSSFEDAFNERLAAFTSRSVTSAATIADGTGRQMLTSGALTFNLRRGGRFIPYAVAGGGLLFVTGDAPTVTLAGDYRFVSTSNTPYRQTDTVTIRYEPGMAFAVLAGGGFKWFLNGRSGIRADVRVHFATDPGTVLINWDPVTIAGTLTNAIAFSGTPAIQIGTDGAFQSTLSLRQTDADFLVASGGRMRQLTNVTVGYFYRFPVAAGASRQPSRPSVDRSLDDDRAWELDVHVGGSLASQLTGGTPIHAFPVGSSFGVNGRPSRRVSSWMFGDGAVLINEVAAKVISTPVPDRMTALDPMLTTSSLQRSQGGSVGARVSRRLTSRMRAAFEVEATPSSMAFTQASIDQMEATRASFVQVWTEVLPTAPGFFVNQSAAMTVVRTEAGRGWQMSLTGGLEYRLWSGRRVTGYATGAAGILRLSATLPEATLTGTYQFTYVFPFDGTMAPLSDQDLVRVHYAAKPVVPVIAAGGGVKYFVTSRSGVRADVRIHASGNSLDTLVDAAPSSVPASPNVFLDLGTNPNLVFSNYPSGSRDGNLSGPALTNLKTFAASGLDIQTSVTVGYFFRF